MKYVVWTQINKLEKKSFFLNSYKYSEILPYTFTPVDGNSGLDPEMYY